MRVPGDEKLPPLNAPGFHVNAVRGFLAGLALCIQQFRASPEPSDERTRFLNELEDFLQKGATSTDLNEEERHHLETILWMLEKALNSPAAKFLGPPEGSGH